jgi:hypothetical protein
VPRASISVVGSPVLQSFSLPTAVISPSTTTIVSASRIGRSMSPDNSRPMFLITTLPDLPVLAASAMTTSEPAAEPIGSVDAT